MEILVDVTLYLTYGLVIGCALTVGGWGFLHLIDGGKALWIKSGIGYGSVILTFLVSYLIASDDGHVCDCSKLVGGLLIMTYVVLALSSLGVLSLLFSKHLR